MYYGRLRTPKVKNELPQLKNLTKLPLDELLKIKQFTENFITKYKPCRSEFDEYGKFNEGIALKIYESGV
jgi:hypothetical protein